MSMRWRKARRSSAMSAGSDLEIVSVDPLEVAAIDVAGYDDEDPMHTDDEEDE